MKKWATALVIVFAGGIFLIALLIKDGFNNFSDREKWLYPTVSLIGGGIITFLIWPFFEWFTDKKFD